MDLEPRLSPRPACRPFSNRESATSNTDVLVNSSQNGSVEQRPTIHGSRTQNYGLQMQPYPESSNRCRIHQHWSGQVFVMSVWARVVDIIPDYRASVSPAGLVRFDMRAGNFS
jgi:hypothetical protein